MALLKNIKWTIGGPENPPGTEATRTHVIPVRDSPGLTARAERGADPAISGQRMDVAEYLLKKDIGGNLPLSPRCCPGFGKLLKSALGLESAPAQIGAIIRIRYTGSSASCKLTADASGDELRSHVGALGAETPDAAFGTAGVIDLTASGWDTVAEVVAEVAGYANYEAELLAGAGAIDSANIIDIVTQAKSRWTYIFFTTTTSGAYLRTFTSDLTDTELPVYSIQGEGYIDTGLLYDGCVADALKLAGALGGFIDGDVEVIGMKETLGEAMTGLELENRDPLLFWQGSTEFAGKDYPFISNLSINLANGHNKDTYGQGLVTRQYQQKALLVVTGDLQVRLDADSYANRADIFTSVMRAASFVFKGKVIAGSVSEMLIVELPFIAATSPFDFPNRSGAFDAKMNWKAFNPKGTKYDVPVKIHFISQDSGAF